MSYDVFDPVMFSVQENETLKEVLGLPPIVAQGELPSNVKWEAIRVPVERVYELQELEKARGIGWTGVEKVREVIDVYLKEHRKWTADRRRGAPRFPSMLAFDERNRGHRFGPGSDSGKVKTYFDENGNRKTLAIELVPDGMTDWTPEWVKPVEGKKTVAKTISLNASANRIECEICGHTESFKPESRASFNAARARISKHLRKGKSENDPAGEMHLEAHTLEFGN